MASGTPIALDPSTDEFAPAYKIRPIELSKLAANACREPAAAVDSHDWIPAELAACRSLKALSAVARTTDHGGQSTLSSRTPWNASSVALPSMVAVSRITKVNWSSFVAPGLSSCSIKNCCKIGYELGFRLWKRAIGSSSITAHIPLGCGYPFPCQLHSLAVFKRVVPPSAVTSVTSHRMDWTDCRHASSNCSSVISSAGPSPSAESG